MLYFMSIEDIGMFVSESLKKNQGELIRNNSDIVYNIYSDFNNSE